MADINYYVDDYIAAGYYVKTVDAEVVCGDYIDPNYLVTDYFTRSGSFATLTCEITRVRYITFSADFASAFTQATESQKTARSSITLSSIANVSAQAMKLRQLSTALESAFTQTTSSSRTARAQASWTSAFSPTIVANASVSNGSDVTANFTISALVGVIKQFPLNQLTGLGTTSSQYGTIDFNQSLFPPPAGSTPVFSVKKNNWTFSVWVKRDSVSGEHQTIAEGLVQEQIGGPTSNNGGIVLKDNDVRIRFNFDADAPGAVWNNVAPTDTEWHHYLFRSVWSLTGTVDTWQLWVDGDYKSTATHSADGDLQFAGRFGSGTGSLYGGLRLGYALIAQDFGSYQIVGAPLLGGVAQVWMGSTTDSQFRVERFYSGLIDLGATGTSTGLPTPVFYNKLTAPYTGVTLNPGATPVPSPATTALGLPSAQGIFALTGEAATVIVTTASLTSQSSLSAVTGIQSRAQASLSAQATVTALARKTLEVSGQLNAQASLAADNQRLRYAASALSAQATATATSTKVQPFQAQLTANSSVTAQADDRTRSQSAQLTSQFTVTARPNDRTRDAIALEAGAFTLTATGLVNRRIGSDMTATATLTADAVKVIVTNITLSAQFTIPTILVYRVLIAEAHLPAISTQLSVIDVINFDPFLTWVVEPESRTIRVLPESRLFVVEQESRAIRVRSENRELQVPESTNNKLTQGSPL